MTEEELAEWQERLAEAVAETLRRRAARATFLAERAAARAHGLRARHEQKLARNTGMKEIIMPTNPEIVRCRYVDKHLQCAEEAVLPSGPVLLCQMHLDRAYQLALRLGLIAPDPEGQP